ncbi:MAG: protease Do [Planctomycetota bacterium]|nr:protease Do [Planctomycetota bacterium]
MSARALLPLLILVGLPVLLPTEGRGAGLDGAWRLVTVEADGRANDVADMQACWVVKGDKVRYGGEEFASLSSNATAMPKTIDLKVSSPKRAYEGIYSIENQTLKVCLNTQTDGAKERPHRFDSKGKPNWRVLVFERIGLDEGNATDGLPGFVGLALQLDEDTGMVTVNDVLGNSPAKKAGLQKGDVVLKIAEEDATDLRSTITSVRRAKPGGKLSVRVRRDGKEKDVTVEVRALPFSVIAQLE